MDDTDESDDNPEDRENAHDKLSQAFRIAIADPFFRKEILEELVEGILEGFDDLPPPVQQLVVELLRKKGMIH
jgi:hypothetical protein